MAKVTLDTISGDYGSKELINANFTALATAMENTLSRDGTSPNTMSADLDMNSNKIINLTDPTNNQDAATKVYVDGLIATGAANAAAAAASASAAATSETNAATSESNAATSETNAAASAAAAAASFDAFDDIYLGAKAADPTVDNDGDALTTGDLYFNTALNQLKVYDGASWSVAPQIPGIVSNADATAITIDSDEKTTFSGDVYVDDGNFLEVGDPGFETAGIDINGTTYAPKVRINDIGGANPAQTVIHRHSTTWPAVLVGARTNDDTTSHAAVTAGQGLFTIYGVGYTGTHYDLFGAIDFQASSAGTISATSSPGKIVFSTAPDGSNTPAAVLTLDQDKSAEFAGNVGIGLTPNASWTTFNALQIGQAGALFANPSNINTRFTSNVYYDGSFRYITTDQAAQINMDTGGNITFDVASSGTAGNAISFTTVMHVSNAGNVGIGLTTPQGALHISEASTAELRMTTDTTGNTSTDGLIVSVDSGSVQFTNKENTPMLFSTNNTERMRIDSSGNVGIGGSPSYLFHILDDSTTWTASLKNSSNTTPEGLLIDWNIASPDNNTQRFLLCQDSVAARCIIYADGDVVNHDGTYGTISDRKLKQDIVDANSQWDDIKAIGAMGKKYRHKKDVVAKGDAAKVMLGWEAQDIETVSPGLVMRTFEEAKDAEGDIITDVNGDPVMEETLGIRSSILFTKAVMALSEAMQRIETLEAQAATLQRV